MCPLLSPSAGESHTHRGHLRGGMPGYQKDRGGLGKDPAAQASPSLSGWLGQPKVLERPAGDACLQGQTCTGLYVWSSPVFPELIESAD